MKIIIMFICFILLAFVNNFFVFTSILIVLCVTAFLAIREVIKILIEINEE